MSITESTPNIKPDLPPQKPSRPYLCVAVPLELAAMAAESRLAALSCIDPIGRQIYDIAPADLERHGVICEGNLISPLSAWAVKK